MSATAPAPTAHGGAWRHPRSHPALPGAGVHVWRAVLDGPAELAERLARSLSADEQERACTFLRARDRRRFVARRGLLRVLLAGYVGCAPEALALRPGRHGKPELAQPSGELPVAFSCSSSQDLAVYAFAHGGRVGVDVEAHRCLPERAQMAQLCCSPREQAALRALPAEVRDAAFLAAWTRKEAYLKAVGVGLTWAPERVEVSLDAAAPALLALEGDAAAAAGWSLHALVPAAGAVGAVAIDRPPARLDCFDATPEEETPCRPMPSPARPPRTHAPSSPSTTAPC